MKQSPHNTQDDLYGIATSLPSVTPRNDIYTTHDFVTSYNDASGKYGERITLTFAGLSLLDFIIAIIFGKDKKQALQNALSQGSLEEVPSRIFQTREIAKKTLFITDQKI